jgi:hypothetical protein
MHHASQCMYSVATDQMPSLITREAKQRSLKLAPASNRDRPNCSDSCCRAFNSRKNCVIFPPAEQTSWQCNGVCCNCLCLQAASRKHGAQQLSSLRQHCSAGNIAQTVNQTKAAQPGSCAQCASAVRLTRGCSCGGAGRVAPAHMNSTPHHSKRYSSHDA